MRNCPYCAARVEDGDASCPHCGEKLLDPAASRGIPVGVTRRRLSPGATLADRYQITREVRRSRLSSVYLATDSLFGIDVTLKLLPVEMHSDGYAMQRLRAEAEAAMSLNHPNIARLLALAETEEAAFFVSEHVNGISFDDLLWERGKLDLEEALHYLKDVAAGLQYAHEHDLVHADLRPANVILDLEVESPIVKIADFCIGRRLAEWAMANGQAAPPTSTFYLAPEQDQGGPLDARTDVYLTAVLFYVFVAGRPRQFSMDRMSLADPILPRPLLTERPDLGNVIRTALAEEPEERWPTVEEFMSALEAAAKSAPTAIRADATITDATWSEVTTAPAAADEPASEQPEAEPVAEAAAEPEIAPEPAKPEAPPEAPTPEPEAAPEPAKPEPPPAEPAPEAEAAAPTAEPEPPPEEPPKPEKAARKKRKAATKTGAAKRPGKKRKAKKPAEPKPPPEPEPAPPEVDEDEMPLVVERVPIGPSQSDDRELEGLEDPKSLVYVPAGLFIMGSYEGNDEQPMRRMFLPGFYLARYPTTNAQYQKFVDAAGHAAPSHWVNGRYPAGEDNCPVVNVSWEDAGAFAKSIGKRLPTEAEWEKAARGTDGRKWPWGNDWEDGEGRMPKARAVAVGQHPDGKTVFGCFDMAGNVWEWTADWYKAYPRSTRNDARFGERYRALRGGPWDQHGYNCRCANRDFSPPNAARADVGFRIAQDGDLDDG